MNSVLKDLANSIEGENKRRETSVYDFSIKFPIIEQIIPELKEWEFEKDIRDSGSFNAVTQAKCFRTRWDMHKVYPSFDTLGRYAIAVANQHPLAGRSKSDGTPDPIEYKIQDSWGLIYEKGNYTLNHSHWPSAWGYVYTVSACDSCSPLVFGQMTREKIQFFPKEGQLLLFPAWLNHHVEEQTCDHPRIKIAGNLNVI